MPLWQVFKSADGRYGAVSAGEPLPEGSRPCCQVKTSSAQDAISVGVALNKAGHA
jgi:hypothetical protein